MEKSERIENLNSIYNDVSKKLSAELLKETPDAIKLTTYRKQLNQLDKDISRINTRLDWC